MAKKKAVSLGWQTEQAPSPRCSLFVLPRAGCEAHKRGIDAQQSPVGGFQLKLSVKWCRAWRG